MTPLHFVQFKAKTVIFVVFKPDWIGVCGHPSYRRVQWCPSGVISDILVINPYPIPGLLRKLTKITAFRGKSLFFRKITVLVSFSPPSRIG